MLKLIVKWLLSAAALLFVAYVYSGVEVKSFTAAMIAAFVIGCSMPCCARSWCC
jgi:putative membrane protein